MHSYQDFANVNMAPGQESEPLVDLAPGEAAPSLVSNPGREHRVGKPRRQPVAKAAPGKKIISRQSQRRQGVKHKLEQAGRIICALSKQIEC